MCDGAEEPLPAGGSCLLSSLNLSEFVKNPFKDNAYFDFEEFKQATKDVTVYMNELLDEGLPLHPLKEQQESVRDWRQIGIGIFALADLFVKMGIRYGSTESLDLSDKIGKSMINAILQQSALLAKDHGTYPKYNKAAVLNSKFLIENADIETYELIEKYGLRNSQGSTIAPTGSLSTMLGVSGGIEPFYMISFYRTTQSLHEEGEKTYKVYTPIAEEYMELNNISKEEDLPNIFVTAMTLNYKERIDMQSVWQKYIDASISSTVNVPQEFTIEQVEDMFMYAWEKGLKGVTMFRSGCKRAGILSGENKEEKQQEQQSLTLSENEHRVTIEKRPKRLYGFTEKVNIPVGDKFGKAYITINVDENNQPFEVFVNANDNEIKSLAEKVGRLTTQFLRYGGTQNNLEQVVKHLKKGEPMTSLSFTVARLLENVAYGKIDVVKMDQEKENKKDTKNIKLSLCPECKTNNYDKGNCICHNCGHSSCS